MLEGTKALAGRRDRQDRQHLGSLTLASETADWPQYEEVSCQVCSLYTSRPHISRPHLYHNRLQTHWKSSSKARLSTLTFGRVYFWLFPLRTPRTKQPSYLLTATALPKLAAGKVATSQPGFPIFGRVHDVGACILNFQKCGKANRFSILCNLNGWSRDCQYAVEFVKY